MRHELFAILDSPDAADAALAEIGSRPEFAGRYAVVVHRDRIPQEASDPVIAHEERGAREGFRFGAVLGATGTAMVLATLEGAYGWVGIGPALAALLGAGAGGASGAFIGGLAGSAYGDTQFQRLATHLRRGRVLVSVRVDGRARKHQIEETLRRHGARTAHRALI
jgi:hypothetical protein